MKKIVLILTLSLFSLITFAQDGKVAVKKDSTWTKGGNVTLAFSQVSLSNWSGGGTNSVSVNALLNLFANYKKGNTSWDNSLVFGYGLTKQGSTGFIKNDDRIDFTSKYGRKTSKNWYYTGLVNFRSQVAPGYENEKQANEIKISDPLAPAYVLISLGMDYKPSKKFSLYLSPATGKITIVNNQRFADLGFFGVEPATLDEFGVKTADGKKSRSQFGGYLKLAFKSKVVENVFFETKLDLFSDYQNDPKNIDVNWEAFLTMKVNDFLSASLNTLLIYDDDIKIDTDGNGTPNGARIQFKQVFGAGLTYKF